MVSGKMSVVFSENGRMKKNREILENTAEREAWGALIGSKLNLPSMSLSVAQLIIDFGLHSSGIIHTHTHTHTHITSQGRDAMAMARVWQLDSRQWSTH